MAKIKTKIKMKYSHPDKIKIFKIAFKMCKLAKKKENANEEKNEEKLDFSKVMRDLKKDGFNITKVPKLRKIMKYYKKHKMDTQYKIVCLMYLRDSITNNLSLILTINNTNEPEKIVNKNVRNAKKTIKNQLKITESFTKMIYVPPPTKKRTETYDVIFRNEIINRLSELRNFFTIEILWKIGVKKLTYSQSQEMAIEELCEYYNGTISCITQTLNACLQDCFIYFQSNNAINKLLADKNNLDKIEYQIANA